MIKYIFSDLDCTLLNSNKEISDKNISTIRKVQDKGIKFMINTGRLPSTFYMYNKILNADSFVSGNGSLIQIDNKIVYSCPLDIDDRFKIFEYGYNNNLNPRVYTKDNFYALNTFDEDELLKKFKYFPIGPLKMQEVLKNEDVYKICFYSNDVNILKNIEKSIIDNCNETLTTYSNYFFLETNNKKVSKGNGVDKICQLYNVDYKDILVIGDNYNDFSMLNNHFISACPLNAIDEVKMICDYVSPYDYNNHAVSDIINHFCDLD